MTFEEFWSSTSIFLGIKIRVRRRRAGAHLHPGQIAAQENQGLQETPTGRSCKCDYKGESAIISK